MRTRGGFVPVRWSPPTPFSSFKTLCTTPSSEKDETADVAPETWRRHCSLEATMVDGTRFLDGFGTSRVSVAASGARVVDVQKTKIKKQCVRVSRVQPSDAFSARFLLWNGSLACFYGHGFFLGRDRQSDWEPGNCCDKTTTIRNRTNALRLLATRSDRSRRKIDERKKKTKNDCSPVEPVKDAVGASFCTEIRTPGNLELGQLQRSDGVFGTVMPFVGSLDRSLQVPEIITTQNMASQKRGHR